MAIAPPFTFTFAGSQPRSLFTAQRLRGEGLVGLHQVEVVDLPAGLLQRLARWPGSGRCP
jgi:hypothetical protein